MFAEKVYFPLASNTFMMDLTDDAGYPLPFSSYITFALNRLCSFGIKVGITNGNLESQPLRVTFKKVPSVMVTNSIPEGRSGA